MSVNTQILDKTIDHSAMIRLFEDKLARDLDILYAKHRTELLDIINKGGSTKQLTNRVTKQVNGTIDKSFKLLSPELRAFISMEADFAADLLDSQAGKIWRVRNTPKSPLISLVGSQAIRDGGILYDELKKVGKGEINRVNSHIRRGIASGESTADIAKGIRQGGALKITKAQSKTLVRTAITQYSTTASDLVYAQNADLLSGYQFVATLDKRTSTICSRNDGREFDIADESAPRPPLHWNCRSTTVPIVKAFNDIDSKNKRVKSKPYSKASDATRASFNGAVPVAENYGAWLKRQDREVQLRHLETEARVDLFLLGNLKLTQFSNTSGKLLTIAALRRLDARATNRVTPNRDLRTVVCRSPCKDFNDKEDFQIATENSEITKTSDFYDGPDAQEAHWAFIDFITYQSKHEGLQLSEYRGDSLKTRRTSYLKTINEPDNLRYNPVTNQLEHSSLVDSSELHTVLTQIRKNIREDTTLSEADKDYLLGRFDTALQEGVQGPAHAAALSAAQLAFRHFNVKNRSFQNQFLGNLYGRTSGVDEVARRLRTNSDKGSFLSRLKNDEFAVVGRQKGATYDEIVDGYDKAIRDVKAFKIDEVIVDDVFKAFKDAKNPLSQVVTKDSIREALQETFIKAKLTNNVDEMARDIGKNLWLKHGRDVSDLESPATTEDFWKAGDQVVKGLSDNKHIIVRIQTHKKVLRDDPLYEEFGQVRYYTNRIIEVSNESLFDIRIARGIINKRHRLGYPAGEVPFYAKEGDVFFRRIDNDELTDIPLHTSGKTSPHYAVDKVQASIINSNTQRGILVDKNGFGDYIAKDLSTPRKSGANEAVNRTASQNELVHRHDYEQLRILNYHLRDDTPDSFSTLHQLHQSGRDQQISILGPGSGEFWRPSLNKTTSKVLGKENWELVTERFAVIADKSTYNSRSLRANYFESMRAQIIKLGTLVDEVITKGQTKNRLVAVDDFMAKTFPELDDPADAYSFQKLAVEIARATATVRGRRSKKFTNAYTSRELEKIYMYRTTVDTEFDAAESGQGIIASITKNPDAAEKTNVVSTGKNDRVRAKVARELLKDPVVRKIAPFLTQKMAEDLLKDQTTTSGYGSAKGAIIQRILNGHQNSPGLTKLFEEGNFLDGNNYLVIGRGFVKRITRALEAAKAGKYGEEIDLSDSDLTLLTKLAKNVKYFNNNGVSVSDDLYSLGRHFDVESKNLISDLQQYGIVTRDQLTLISQKASDIFDGLLPSRKEYFSWMQDLMESYQFARLNDGDFSGAIPVISWDGREGTFIYKARERYRSRFIDDDGNEVLIDIVSDKPSELDLASLRKAGPVEFIFFQDSGIAGRHALAGRNNIYDGFEDNLGNLRAMIDDNVEIYADLVDSNILLKQLDFMRERGLPDRDFTYRDETGTVRKAKGYFTLLDELEELLGDLIGEDVRIAANKYGSYIID